MEIGLIKSSPNKHKSTSVVYLVVSAAQNGQFDRFERFCIPLGFVTQSQQLCNKSFLLPDIRVSSFSLSCPLLQSFNWQASKQFGKGRKCCKWATQSSGCLCNIHEVSTPGYYVVFFFGDQNFSYGDHFTTEGHQKATF